MKRATLLLAVLIPASAVAADELGGEPGNVVKYRQNAFQGMGKHMKALGMMAKGKVDLPAADRLAHARSLHEAARSLPGWFPAGTGPDAKLETEALAPIWTDRAGFEKAAGDFEAAAANLVAKAEAGDADAFKAAFGGVGKTCGGCHDGFRKKDEDR